MRLRPPSPLLCLSVFGFLHLCLVFVFREVGICRRLGPQEYAALKKEVDKQLKQRLIMPIVSPFSAPPMVIPKPPV